MHDLFWGVSLKTEGVPKIGGRKKGERKKKGRKREKGKKEEHKCHKTTY